MMVVQMNQWLRVQARFPATRGRLRLQEKINDMETEEQILRQQVMMAPSTSKRRLSFSSKVNISVYLLTKSYLDFLRWLKKKSVEYTKTPAPVVSLEQANLLLLQQLHHL
ncbi:hypothetical protein L1987_20040 [Smallanthus sonchifolius]|uniref:Uncharacterized protein n=1 Tax=Smallanthus sonchifolius TaxID=185202 RepID=A0ACB9IQB2_9ASTR|nr:hypothetical protein L1987_20040 [Smallanthus sonchifolius]